MKFLITLLLSLATYFPSKETQVYVCKGGYAYAYHQKRNCVGLYNCRAAIVQMSEYDAKSKYKRRRCSKCY